MESGRRYVGVASWGQQEEERREREGEGGREGSFVPTSAVFHTKLRSVRRRGFPSSSSASTFPTLDSSKRHPVPILEHEIVMSYNDNDNDNDNKNSVSAPDRGVSMIRGLTPCRDSRATAAMAIAPAPTTGATALRAQAPDTEPSGQSGDYGSSGSRRDDDDGSYSSSGNSNAYGSGSGSGWDSYSSSGHNTTGTGDDSYGSSGAADNGNDNDNTTVYGSSRRDNADDDTSYGSCRAGNTYGYSTGDSDTYGSSRQGKGGGDRNSGDNKNDSTIGRIAENVGDALRSDGLRETGREKREDAGYGQGSDNY
ncbi:hypothetical protein DL771_000835 [Monosporascus sp. 5C6A]|nr:hypothetical protein DL771_000835 [Monosporascus sp. 5C6A]